MYETLLFDLDGTLTDSGRGITNSVAYALEKYGIRYESKKELECFIGPPLVKTFMSKYGLTEDEGKHLVTLYREYYSVKGIFENDVYPGIPELLRKLCKSGKRLIVATSKPEHFAVKILEHFDLAKYFTCIAGATMDETRTDKDDVIKYALSKGNITELSKTVMIGDREYDILGAKKIGTDSIGVLYGYGSRAELESAGATYIAQNVNDIMNFI
ncbi:MAG: HAD family hydrolase [Clostridia bacterium]|nr:HAD family hydrolase [Clostridia bacterium]